MVYLFFNIIQGEFCKSHFLKLTYVPYIKLERKNIFLMCSLNQLVSWLPSDPKSIHIILKKK